MKDLHAKLPDETMAALVHIGEVTGKSKTDVIIGMIEHWAGVVAEHERRGFHVVPTPAASLAAAMVAERSGMFDELPKSEEPKPNP